MEARASDTPGCPVGHRRLGTDDRAFSEGFAVGVLVGLTVLMAISAGFYVVAVDTDESDTLTGNFSYDYSADGDALIVRYVDGPSYRADDVVVESGRHEVTWKELAGLNVNGTLEPGAAVQLSGRSDWSQPVTGVDTIRIHHEANNSRRQLANWTAE